MRNICDIIIEEKRKNLEKGYFNYLVFFWGKEGYLQLKEYVNALVIPLPEEKRFLSKENETEATMILENTLKQPFRFMGADHTWDETKEGFLLNIKIMNAIKRKKLSDYYPNGQCITIEVSQYISLAVADGVEELEVSAGELVCLCNYFRLKADWDFRIWGIKIIVIQNENQK